MIYRYYTESEVIAHRFVVRKIMHGGMGVVYVCFDKKEQQFVALKTFKSEHFTDDKIVDRFKKECEIWASIPWHINIVRAYGVIMFNNIPFIAIEYIAPINPEGSNLRELMNSRTLSLKDR